MPDHTFNLCTPRESWVSNRALRCHNGFTQLSDYFGAITCKVKPAKGYGDLREFSKLRPLLHIMEEIQFFLGGLYRGPTLGSQDASAQTQPIATMGFEYPLPKGQHIRLRQGRDKLELDSGMGPPGCANVIQAVFPLMPVTARPRKMPSTGFRLHTCLLGVRTAHAHGNLL